MANYLKQENQLIVWPVLREVMENDLFQGNIGIISSLFRCMEG